MKKLCLFLFLIGLGLNSFAQRYENVSNLNIAGGYNFEEGYNATANYEKFLGSKYSLELGLEYFKSKDEIKNLLTKIDINNVLANGSINTYIAITSKIHFRIGAGATAGYQYFTFDKPDYVKKTEDNRLVFGLIVPAQLEFNLGSVSIFTQYKPSYLLNARQGYNGYVSIGLKYY